MAGNEDFPPEAPGGGVHVRLEWCADGGVDLSRVVPVHPLLTCGQLIAREAEVVRQRFHSADRDVELCLTHRNVPLDADAVLCRLPFARSLASPARLQLRRRDPSSPANPLDVSVGSAFVPLRRGSSHPIAPPAPVRRYSGVRAEVERKAMEALLPESDSDSASADRDAAVAELAVCTALRTFEDWCTALRRRVDACCSRLMLKSDAVRGAAASVVSLSVASVRRRTAELESECRHLQSKLRAQEEEAARVSERLSKQEEDFAAALQSVAAASDLRERALVDMHRSARSAVFDDWASERSRRLDGMVEAWDEHNCKRLRMLDTFLQKLRDTAMSSQRAPPARRISPRRGGPESPQSLPSRAPRPPLTPARQRSPSARSATPVSGRSTPPSNELIRRMDECGVRLENLCVFAVGCVWCAGSFAARGSAGTCPRRD
eukprot:TRINITY_DN14018_c0_g1_i1.p1 TRINITY_DN14018_c0_g1~~TRINITY_DN14018_c0_g1_i1.p1  ORF type:complete len:452 (+),score=136.01 TRINITY_DN14018_c0_g1_i1:57-1358(+)